MSQRTIRHVAERFGGARHPDHYGFNDGGDVWFVDDGEATDLFQITEDPDSQELLDQDKRNPEDIPSKFALEDVLQRIAWAVRLPRATFETLSKLQVKTAGLQPLYLAPSLNVPKPCTLEALALVLPSVREVAGLVVGGSVTLQAYLDDDTVPTTLDVSRVR